MKPESLFRQKKVIPFLKTLKNTCFFSIQQRSISGHPDLLLCCNGRFVALELKAEGGKPTSLQKATLAWVEGTGGISIVAYPNGWEWIKLTLASIDGGTYDEHDKG